MSNHIIITDHKSKITGKIVPHVEDTYKGTTEYSEIYELPIKQVYAALKNSNQVRQGDFSVKHINDLITSIQTYGQLNPILVGIDTKNTLEDVINGFCRAEAIYKLYSDAKTPHEKKKYSTIKVANVLHPLSNLEEKQLYQIEKNIAIPAKGNDDATYIWHLQMMIPDLPKTASTIKQKKFISDNTTYCKNEWPSLHPKTRERLINERKKGITNSKLKNWTATKVLNSIRQACKSGTITNFNWQGKKQGEWWGNVCIYPISRISNITGPNTFGGIWNRFVKVVGSKFTFREKKMIVALWELDTAAKSENDIDDYRDDGLDKINLAKSPIFLNDDYLSGLITNVLLAPQKATGKNKENPDVFPEVQRDADGNFSLDIPHPIYGDLKKGW